MDNDLNEIDGEQNELSDERVGSVEIRPRYDLTLNRVRELMASGMEIVYTPHIGNKATEDTYLAGQGVPQVTFTRNAMHRDIIDEPHRVRLNGSSLKMVSAAQADVITPFADLDGEDAATVLERYGKYGKTPAQIHHATTQAAIPGHHYLADRFVFQSDDIGRRMLDLLDMHGKKFPETWNRAVIEKRIAKQQHRDPSRAVQEFHDLMTCLVDATEGTSDKRIDGPIPTNAFLVAMLAIRGIVKRALETTGPLEAEGYTVSGPSMIKYVTDKPMMRGITSVYRTLREVHPELPPKMMFNVIPGALFDFMPYGKDTAKVNLVRDLARMEIEKDAINRSIAATKGNKGDLIAAKKRVELAQNPLREAFNAMPNPTEHSQYYVLEYGDTIADIPEVRELTFRSVTNLFHAKRKS